MIPLQNDLLLKALKGERVPRPPVWMMRQAGRYLPDFRKLKERYSFFERCETPELAAEITVMPVDQVGVDAAILFSDILVVPKAMGMIVELADGKGPVLPHPIRSAADLVKLSVPDVQERLQYVFAAIKLSHTRLEGRVPLIGFAGAPWTILCYMVQGNGTKSFDEAKAFCFSKPDTAHQLLQMITDTTIAYLRGQSQAGVDLVQLFDSWGGLLSPEDFGIYSLPYSTQIIHAMKDICPVILFAKGAWHALEAMAATGATALGLDWGITPRWARKLAGNNITLQGNLDPARLLSPIPEIIRCTKEMVTAFGTTRYIANLGHGILPEVPVAHARAFVDTIKAMA